MNVESEYKNWLEQVKEEIEDKCALHMEDLPDYDYAIAWEQGYSPEEAAAFALEAAGFDIEVD